MTVDVYARGVYWTRQRRKGCEKGVLGWLSEAG